MSLLAPWFLAGLALLAAPVVAHLIRRATRDRVAFSAVRFLTPSAPRLDRRSRIQHPLLLALRLLILALLALAFARPYFKGSAPLLPAAEPPRHIIAILDRSASMQRGELWTDARDRVATLAGELAPHDDFTLLLADTRPRELLAASTWRATAPADRDSLVAGLLESETRPGWSAFHLDDAVNAALDHHRELSAEDNSAPSAPAIHVFSDLAAGTRVSGLASLAWPTGAALQLDPLDDRQPTNIAIQWLGWGVAPADAPGEPARLRLTATRDTPTTSVRLRIHDPETDAPLGEPFEQVLARGGTATVALPVPAEAPAAFAIDLEGDAVAFDNRLWVVRPIPRRLPVVLFGEAGADDPARPAYYLTRALQGWSDPVAELSGQLPPVPDPAKGTLPPFIIAPAALPADRVDALRDHVEAGATALLLVDDSAAAARAAQLLGDDPWRTTAAVAGASQGYALFGQIDFEHPLFLPFADPRYSDFSKIRFWSRPHLALPENSRARTIARFDDGSPAVMEAMLGRGRVVIWAGGWTPAQSHWVLSSKFVPWLQALAERAAGGALRASVTGLDRIDRLGEFADLTPLAHGPAPGAATPGLYQLSRDGLPPRTVALNVPERESDLAPLDLDVFARLGVPLGDAAAEAAERSEQQRRDEAAYLTESRQKVWRWLLLAAALLLVTESLLSLRLARRAPALT